LVPTIRTLRIYVREDVRIRGYFSKPKGAREQNILGYTALDHVPNSVRNAQKTSINPLALEMDI